MIQSDLLPLSDDDTLYSNNTAACQALWEINKEKILHIFRNILISFHLLKPRLGFCLGNLPLLSKLCYWRVIILDNNAYISLVIGLMFNVLLRYLVVF